MKNFEYAQPTTEQQVLQLLDHAPGETALLAGGTDLVGLLKKMVVAPQRVVYLGDVQSLYGIEQDASDQLWVGANVSLLEFLDSSLTDRYPAVKQVIQGINSLQLQSQGTVVGELLRRPECWYFRNGEGLLSSKRYRGRKTTAQPCLYAVRRLPADARSLSAVTIPRHSPIPRDARPA